MKNSIILLVKECISAHSCIQTEHGIVTGFFLDDTAINHIANDVANALVTHGIDDVTKWKKRAEVAERNDKIKERALENLSRHYEIIAGFSESEADLEELAQVRFEAEIREAEKEIKEED